MKKEINPKDGVHGKWYVVDTDLFKWLIKFDKFKNGRVYDLACYNTDNNLHGDSKLGFGLEYIRSFIEATPEEVGKYFPSEINAMQSHEDKCVYVYTDKEDGLIYMLPKFDPHVGGHNIDQVLSKAEDNSVIYEARPVGIKKVYLEGV